MPWGSSLFPLLIVTSSGRFTGLFVYSPAPGNGNLIASITASAGTDPFGNAFDAGITSYTRGGGLLINMLAGVLNFADTLSADALTSNGLVRIIHMAAHGASPIVAIDAPAADTNTTHSSLWLLGAPQGYTSGPVQAAFFADNATGGSAGEAPLDLIVCPGAGGSLTFGAISAITGTPAGNKMMWLAPSGDTSGTTDTNRLVAAVGVNGYSVVILLPGTFYVISGNVALIPGQHLLGSRKSVTIVQAVDNAAAGFKPVFSIHNNPGSYLINTNAGISDMRIDGTGTTKSNGVEFGDVVGIELRELVITNFVNGTGLYGNNKQFFTEQWRGTAYVSNCFNALALDANGGTNSFDRPDFTLWVDCRDTQNAVHLLGGATGIQVGEGVFNLFGNFSSGATGGGCAFLFDPVGGNRNFLGVNLNVGVETDNVGPHFAQTMKFAAASDLFVSCYGTISFSGARTSLFVASNNNSNIQFDGKILGDDTLRTKMYAPDVVTVNATAPLAGSMLFEKLAASGKVFAKFAVQIPAGTTLNNGGAMGTVTDPFYLHTDNTIIPLWVNGGGLNQAASAIISSAGVITNNGPALAAVGSTAFLYGQAVYSNSF